MSLQIWLPFLGNANNQGLDNTIFTEKGNIIYSTAESKIGSSSFDGKSGCFIFPWSHKDTNELSYAAWVKPNTPSAWQDIFSFGEGFQRIEVDNTLTQYRWYCTTGTSLVDNGSTIFSIPNNEWHHIAFTANGTKVTFYLDGKQTAQLTQRIAISQSFGNSLNCRIGNRTDTLSGPWSGYQNDIRIYDHCLSSKEIQEISKGLIVHMPLDNNGMGGVNLFKGNYSAVTTKDGTVQSGDITFDTSIMNLNSLIGKTIWYSFDYQCLGDKLNATGNYTTDRYGSHLTLNYVDSSGTAKTSYPCASMLEFTGTGRTVQSYTIPSNIQSITSLSGTKQPYNRPAATNNATWYLKNFKLEVGDYATPYSPNPTDVGIDLKSINEVSGFNLTGTAVQVMNVVNNTPRYNVSTQWKDTTDFIRIPNFFAQNQLIDEITIAGWFKTDNLNGTAPNMFNYGANDFVRGRIAGSTSLWSYWNINGSKQGVTVGAGKTLNDNIWHHYAFSFNKGVIKTYVDGILKNTTDHTATGTQLKVGSISDWGLGGYTPTAEKFLGYQSDFRTYCTALEDSEILELYEGRPGIDNNGNGFFYKIEENEATPVGIKNTCVAMTPRNYYEDDIENIAYDQIPYDYTGVVHSKTPTKDGTNQTLTPGFKIHYGGKHMHNKKAKISMTVEWNGFDTSSTAGTFNIRFQGAVLLQDGTSAWTTPTGSSNQPCTALMNAKNLKDLVLSATSGTYNYETEFTIKCGTGDDFAAGHIVSMRADYSNGTGWIKFSNIKVTPMEAFSSDDQPFKISEDNITANYIYEF